MSMDLPSASSVLGARPRRPGSDRRRFIALPAAAAAVVVIIGVNLAAGVLSRPRIDRLDPAVGERGGLILVEGRNFGAERGSSRVEIDGVVPTASSYLSWSDTAISLRLPASVDSGLVRVITSRGRSNALLFMNRDRLPAPAGGTKEGRSGPFIASLSAESGQIGSLLVLTGLDFGVNRENSMVVFSWTSEEEGVVSGDQAPPRIVVPSEEDFAYELWSDKEIRVRVPDGAVSGPVYVQTGKGVSNGLFFRVIEGPGRKRYSSRSTFALSSSVEVTKIRASGANELYLWAPLPVSSSAQRLIRVLEQDPIPMVSDYRGTALFHFSNLTSGKAVSVRQSFLVQSFAVEAVVDAKTPALSQRDRPALAAAYTAADILVPADDPAVAEALKKAAPSERGTWKAVMLICEWLMKNLSWSGKRTIGSPVDALRTRRADSYAYALAACALMRAAGVPTIPVAGCLIDPKRGAVRHYWLEVYFFGLGWVPLDPILASGAFPGGVAPAWDDRSRYLCGVDARRVAFSRGLTELAPMASGGHRATKDRYWSFQTFFEESSGALDAYSSFWGDIEVTGAY
jgi:hypothetical protein